ncbi:DUF2510 domain-containing protein [Nocardia sp. NPDC048505]|uniref:DUF2510 domain-containing protein n=1 Tax=Nocardia sp. NPDC048505 TaxID=3155756 RepID=UPI003411985C
MAGLSVGHIVILLGIIAVVVIAIVAITRSNARRPAQPPLPPGWYPDHHNPTLVRWFDGYQWTNQTQPRQ